MKKKILLLPQEALSIRGTMTWAGDVAKMLARLLFNPASFGETYTAATAENHTWGEIADYYKSLAGMWYQAIPKEDYLSFLLRRMMIGVFVAVRNLNMTVC